MIEITKDQAILLRILSAFFGKERVIPKMSVFAVCGGCLPHGWESSTECLNLPAVVMLEWAKHNRCLFTIVDAQDVPKLVIELEDEQEADVVDISELERRQYLEPLLRLASIAYIRMTRVEFGELTNPHSALDIFSYLKAKFGGQPQEEEFT